MFALTKKRLIILAAIIVIIPVAAIAWWLGSPLFIDKTVEEEFPFARNAIVPVDMTRADVENKMEEASEINNSVNDAMPDAIKADPAAVALKAGEFSDADSRHRGEGTATIYQGPDGSYLLRLEDFRVTNGPDLHVILSPHPNPERRGDVTDEGYIDLGSLKGNIGSQNYEIPSDVDISAFNSVIIYCQPFHVIFSVAPLSDAT